ncbi:hypothetical protein AB0D65_29085 [Streptomyces griseoloalbus]|uniref:Uncharacterized protein n=1 Tax=Streptomyces griseoloalbus TaxID=67303 RepID=A0ABV3ECQ3_9ACTN
MTTELRAYNAKDEQLYFLPDENARQFEAFDTVGAAFDRMEALKSAYRWDRERRHDTGNGFVRNRIAYFRMDDEKWTRDAVTEHAQVRAARKAKLAAHNDGASTEPQEAVSAPVLADWERETLARAGEAPAVVRDVTADEEAAQEAQEDAALCTHSAECDTPAVGSVRAVNQRTGKGLIAGVFCSGHLTHPAETFTGDYRFEYLPVDAREPQKAPAAPAEEKAANILGPGAKWIRHNFTPGQGLPYRTVRRDSALDLIAENLRTGAKVYPHTEGGVKIEPTNSETSHWLQPFPTF